MHGALWGRKGGETEIKSFMKMSLQQNISPGECAVRMARAGAKIIGVNCLFDPFLCLETLRQMKEAIDEAGKEIFYLLPSPSL